MNFYQRWYFDDCVLTASWAAGVAFALLLLGAVGEGGTTGAGRAAAVAVVVGFMTALVTFENVPPVPVVERWQWVPWIAAAALLLLFVEEGRSADIARVPLLIALAGALQWFILRPSSRLEGVTEPLRSVILFGAGTVAFALFWTGEARAAPTPMWRTFGLYALTAGAAAVCFATHSTRYGRVTGGIAATLGAIALFGVARAKMPAGRTAVTTANVAFGGMLLVNGLSSDFKLAPTLLLLASWLVPLFPNPGTVLAGALQLLGCVAPAGLAVFVAMSSS